MRRAGPPGAQRRFDRRTSPVATSRAHGMVGVKHRAVVRGGERSKERRRGRHDRVSLVVQPRYHRRQQRREAVNHEQTHVPPDVHHVLVTLQSTIARNTRVPRQAQRQLLQNLEQRHDVVHVQHRDEIQGEREVLLHLVAIRIRGDEPSVKLLYPLRAETPAGVQVYHPVTQRGGGRGSAQAKLRLARPRLASELGHLALSEAALEQVVDAVAARRQKIELTELLLYRGTVEDLRGDAEGGVGCERDGVVSKRDSVRGSCLRSVSPAGRPPDTAAPDAPSRAPPRHRRRVRGAPGSHRACLAPWELTGRTGRCFSLTALEKLVGADSSEVLGHRPELTDDFELDADVRNSPVALSAGHQAEAGVLVTLRQRPGARDVLIAPPTIAHRAAAEVSMRGARLVHAPGIPPPR